MYSGSSNIRTFASFGNVEPARMITYPAPQTKPNAPQVGERVELARYRTSNGERILHGQRIDGVVRVTDVPATGHGRAYLVERELDKTATPPSTP